MILVIDDNAAWMRALGRQLRAMTVATAQAPDEGIQLARELRPRVIVLDAYFDGCSKLEAIHPLRAAAPRAKIVVVTSYANPADRECAFIRGASAYIDKRDHRSLLGVIRAAISDEAA